MAWLTRHANQYQILADKYAPTAPEISETLAQLQLPPELHHPVLINANTIPLPKRGQAENSQHQIALFIREGRRAAQQLMTLADASNKDSSSKETSSRLTATSITTMMEQDFTVEGKKGNLQCPFSVIKEQDESGPNAAGHSHGADPTPHKSGDPICAAMFEEATSQPQPASASKCPIRYMDKHSPEEIATYVENHKHQIPRSHEVCIQRYQKNEAQIRKLDAKYGNLVNMIQDLSQLHKPLLPEGADPAQHGDGGRASLERVENWAQGVSTNPPEDPETPPEARNMEEDEPESTRESHFDRPLKEVRVGESPSRPWGISVPIYDEPVLAPQAEEIPVSPPPVPVQMPSPVAAETPKPATGRPSKCPFDHTKFSRGMGMAPSPLPKVEEATPSTKPTGQGLDQPGGAPRPTFLGPDAIKPESTNTPQMVFNGPVFIGYPMEQAIQFMKHFQTSQ